MRIIAYSRIKAFSNRPGRQDAKQPLLAWYKEAQKAKWKKPDDIKAKYGSASFIANNRVVFNIAGNKYRLVVKVRYDKSILFVRFIGTHEEYDDIDATMV
jgi:mRNA interferase HigB